MQRNELLVTGESTCFELVLFLALCSLLSALAAIRAPFGAALIT